MAFECQKDTEVALSKQLGKLAHNSSKEPSLYSKFKGKGSCDQKKPSSLALANGFRASFKDEDFPSTCDLSSPVPLKNKRPSRLDIPNISLCFGGLAVTPRGPAADSVFEEEGKNGYYSVCCKRGKSRAVMEDRYCASLDLQDNPKQAFFGVFDGHGGCKAAEFAAKNLGKNIMEEVSRDKADKNETNLHEAVKHGYLKTDSDFLKEDLHGGSCCVTALISNGDLVVSNAGDCRAVVSRASTAQPLTTDHRPSRPDEKDRIEATGGYIDCYHGVWRIQGSLAVSRAIGDRNLKQWVISEPETKTHKIESDYEFLILASDGLWDKVTDQEAVDIARPICAEKNNSDSLAACKKLVDLSASRGSLDDISVMVIQLQHYV